MISQKDQTILLTFRLLSSYDHSVMNRLLFLLLSRPIEQYLTRLMIIYKPILFSEEIEAFLYILGQSIFGDL